MREPGRNVLKPAEHEPAVYMPAFPAVDAATGAERNPLAPTRLMTRDMGARHMGGVIEGVVVRVAMRLRDKLCIALAE